MLLTSCTSKNVLDPTTSVDRKNSVDIEQKLAKLEKLAAQKIALPMSPERMRQYEKQGLCIILAEGDPYLYVDYAALRFSMRNNLPKDWDMYLQIMDDEVRRPVMEDAAIRSFFDLEKRIFVIENFLQQFPKFHKADELKKCLNLSVNAFTKGVDNTKPKDFIAEALQAYGRFFVNSPNSAYKKQVEDARNILIPSETQSRKSRIQ
ncbi:MAG: hypothetical protein LBF66_01155 [Holosporales bacterium]|jgi:hypothetical protein|nr:hypothetical protein [Holosporales bacterium]